MDGMSDYPGDNGERNQRTKVISVTEMRAAGMQALQARQKGEYGMDQRSWDYKARFFLPQRAAYTMGLYHGVENDYSNTLSKI